VGSLLVRVCYNKGKSTNMLHITLVITAVISCWLMYVKENTPSQFS
jgi:V-type H+-transporting ATPase subunit e